MKNNMERWCHLNMALIGGFIAGYGIVNHSDLLGTAQTGNLIALSLYLAGMHSIDWLIRLGGMGLYMLGIACTVFLPRIIKNINLRQVSILLDMTALAASGLLPSDTDHFVALYPLFFVSAVQLCSFQGADGFSCSSIFSTNNLRQCTASMTEYLFSHDREALRKAKFFGKVLLSFHLGAALSFPASQALGLKSAWLGLLPCGTAFLLERVLNRQDNQRFFQKKYQGHV